MGAALLELGIIIGITLIITALMNFFKQPFIIGYIITGILVNYLGILKSSEAITLFGEIGILFLLFMVGIGLNPKVIKQTGKVAIITGLGQIIFTSLIGFIICIFLGYSVVTSLFISIALTLSSTIVIMKLLSDKGDLESLYGRISIGFLIIQDIIAMFVLMGISSFSSGFGIKEMLINTFAVGIGMVVILLMISHFFMPKIIGFIAKSQEFLLLFSLGWCMALSALFYYMKFSVEIGALLAGITLSLSPYRYEISSKTKNIRDFFIVLFFIWLGSQLVVSDIVTYFAIILYFSAFVLIGNPLIVMILMGILGYTKRTGFLAGLTVAQVSEFSLIIIAMGVKFGYLGKEILSIITMVTIITIAGSTYFIIYGNKIFKHLSNYLKIFERKGKKVDEYKYHDTKESYEIILFGYNRVGLSIANSFRKLKMRFLVVDYNPDTIFDMAKKGIHCRYGDADDYELLDELNFPKLKLIVSTIPDIEVNTILIHKIKKERKNALVLVVAHQIEDAIKLYSAGATYVIMPHFLGGDYTATLIENCGINLDNFLKEKVAHLAHLQQRQKMNHTHPHIEKN